MAKLARDVMTPNPVCCTAGTSIEQVAILMADNGCGEIPVVDENNHLIGVITDRDIVCRIVAEGLDPAEFTAEMCMTQPVVSVRAETSLKDVVTTMEEHQIRRVPVVEQDGGCSGIIAQADVARVGRPQEIAELIRELSRDTRRAMH